MATTKGVTVGEREAALGELLLREPEIIAWLALDDSNVGNDSPGIHDLTESFERSEGDA